MIREDKILDKLGGELQAFIYIMKSTGLSPALNELSEMIEYGLEKPHLLPIRRTIS